MTTGCRKWFITCLVLLLGAVWARADDGMTARHIMEKQKDRHSVTSETEVDVMLLVDRRGNKQQREMKRYFKKMEDGTHRALLVFTAPADIRGTSLLIWEQKDRDDDQWLYLPARKKMQRIGKGSKKSYFMGTDFTYQDMEPEQLDDYKYKLLKEEKIEGKDCFVIEAVPRDEEQARKSPYKRRVLWVRKDILITVKIEFYARNDRLIKTQTNHELKNADGDIWRADKALMDNKKKRHKTVVGVKSREFNGDVEDSVFTERFILSGQHLK